MSAQPPSESASPKEASPEEYVHPLVRTSAAWTWRLLVLFGGILALGYIIERMSTVMIPTAIALLGAAMLAPIVDWLQRHGVPRAAAVVVVLVGSIGILAGILTFVIQQFIAGLPELSDQITTSINKVRDWLATGPLQFSDDKITKASESVIDSIESHQDTLTSGALATATAIGEFVTGALLALFILIFFLYGGREIWEFVTRIVPTANRQRVRIAGTQAFRSLVGFVRATVGVAAVDAIGIGIGLAILGVPLALPLASLVFIGAFIPIIGALLTGFVAVLVALVTKGLVTALITLGIIIAVMQLEGHVLQPLLLGRAVRIHPLAVVLAITAGIVLFGIAGGLLAVPVVAMVNTAVRSLLAEDPDILDAAPPGDLYEAEPDEPDVVADAEK